MFCFVFSCKIFALQYCPGFCYTSTWISHRCTYVHCRYTSEILWVQFQTTIIEQILQKKTGHMKFFGFPVLPRPPYWRMVKTFICVWQRTLLQSGFHDRSELHRMLFERLVFQLSWGNTANTLVLLLVHRTFKIKSLTKPQLRRASLVAQLVKNPPEMQETAVRFLGREDLLEKG